jgi:TonB-linked SusC/RagA family outer membrane protein
MLKPKTINTIIMMKIYQFKLRRRLMVPLLGMVLFITNPFIAQNLNITGTITSSEDGAPIPGCSIVVKGIQTGTTSDFDGNFSIVMPSGSSILVFRYLGFESKEVSVASNTALNIVLSPDAMALDEIVIVGYGTMRKSDVTGALSSVSAKAFEEQPLTRIDQALQGRAAGVSVTQNSGAPGAGFKIRIRGSNSLGGNNTPLYVVDGMVIGDINSINVNDVQSMEVLKDASATAIYGSRGANGVVLITTKKGRKGAAKVVFESFYGVAKVAQGLNYMTPAEFAVGVNHAESQEIYDAAAISALENGGGQYWEDRLFEDAPFSNKQLSFSGGSDAIDYYISGNLSDQDGTVISQNYKRYGLRANINGKISNKIKVGVNTYLSKEEETGVRATLSTGLTWDMTTPAFNNEGEYNATPLIPGVGNGQINPLIGPQNNIRENYNHQIITSAYLNYDVLDNLVLNISGGYENNDRENNSYTSVLVNGIGSARVYNQEVSRMQNTNRLTYTYDKNENHKVQVDAVYEQQYVTNVWTESTSEGFFSDNTTYKNLSLGAIQRTDNRSVSESLQSFLGRVNYSLFDKFLFTASIRADGSSKFQEGNQWGYFPSISTAWKLSDETFIQNVDVISNLKVRASYGIIGSQAIDPLATKNIPIIGPNVNYPYTGGTPSVGVGPSNRLANPDLTWESTTQTNIGFDLGLWNSKLTLSLDLYKKNTTDLLLDRVLPSYVGPTVIAQNVGEVENKGLDATLGWNVFKNEDWNISSTFNLSSNKNEVISLVDGQDSMELGNVYYDSTFPVNPTQVQVGEPMSTFRGYQFDGVYQLGEEAEAAVFGKSPGDARYVDINGDGNLTTDDITTVGDGNADYTWGWNWDISYKKFDFNFVLLGSQGNDIYNLHRMKMMGLGSSQFHAVHADYNNRWTPTNPSNIPSRRDGQEFLSSQFIEDGSYVTLKNVVIGYSFDNFLNNIGLDDLRVYCSAENLFIITDYTGFDPESTASGNSDVDLGIDYNAYPISRSFTLGFKLTF